MRIFLIVPLVVTSISSNAEIYKWTDANGKVHYSDKEAGKGTTVRVQNNPPADANAKTRLELYKTQLNGDRQLKEKDAAKEQQRLAELDTQCARIRNRLINYESVGQIVQVKDGESTYLDHQEKDKAMAEMRLFLREYCD